MKAGLEMGTCATGEAMRMLGVSRQRVHQLACAGKISGMVVAGRWVYSRRSVAARIALLEKEAMGDDRAW